MQIDPSRSEGTPPKGPDKSDKKPPKKDFKKAMEGVGPKKEQPQEKKAPPPKPFDLKRAQAQREKEREAAQQLAKEEAALAAVADQGGQKGGGAIKLPADVQASGQASAVEKILAIFQNNKIYGSQVQQVQLSQSGAETKISVQLQNGVEVNINLSGGKELNIQIQGITQSAQAAMDNAAHQQQLRERLAEQGFVIHQIQTIRAEGPAVAAPPPPQMAPPSAPPGGQPFYGGEREREGEGGGEEPEEEER
ncbi:MAG: hypothetical protein AB7F31_00705 [Parachlamydiales bacterium]